MHPVKHTILNKNKIYTKYFRNHKLFNVRYFATLHIAAILHFHFIWSLQIKDTLKLFIWLHCLSAGFCRPGGTWQWDGLCGAGRKGSVRRIPGRPVSRLHPLRCLEESLRYQGKSQCSSFKYHKTRIYISYFYCRCHNWLIDWLI